MDDKSYTHKADLFGSVASTMCMLHCLATPFVFLVPTSNLTCGAAGPWWWHMLDYLFLLFGFLAIYKSLQNTDLKWMTFLMYGSWILLTIFIINGKAAFFSVHPMMFYLPAFSLIGLHLYNLIHQRRKAKAL